MLTLLYYCLKVIICCGLLYGYYLLALRNNRFHHWNRYYLLAIIVVSFTLPLLQIPLPFLEEDERPVVQSFRIISAPDIYFSKLSPPQFAIDWPMIAGVLYGCIVLAFVLLFIKKIFSVLNLKKCYPEENLNGIHFYHTNEPATPFSFFKNIFWNNSISLSTEKGQQMLRHELTHVQEGHSIDKVLLELLIAVAWWNPFLCFIRKELAVIHEFIADQKASAGDDKLQYASLLLMKAMGSQQFALGNPFFHSQLKRRLVMLTTIKNPRFSYVRRLLVLPLAAVSLILFSFKYKEVKDKQKAALQKHVTAIIEDEFNGDSTKPKFYIQLNKTYKGSAVESIMPTTDMSGAIVKTTDDKTYFLDREAAAKELSFIITDSGFIAPPGAVLVTEKNKTVARNGAFIQTPTHSNFPQYQYTVDTTAFGLSKAISSIQVQDIHVDFHQDIPLNEFTKIDIDSLPSEFRNALIIVDGKRLEKLDISGELKQLDIKSFKSLDILRDKKSIAKYGEEGKNGVITITTKAKESLPDNALYVIDGIVATKEKVEALDQTRIQAVNVLKGESATTKYSDKGKNGVIEITTKPDLTEKEVVGHKLVKNEVTFDEAGKDEPLAEKVVIGHRIRKDGSAFPKGGNDNSLTEKVVIGHKIRKDGSAFPEGGDDNSLTEKVVRGYRIRKDSSAAKNQPSAALAKQPNDLDEVVVVGYQIFTKVDNPASFPGGVDGWRRYLAQNLQYPKAAQEKGTQGVVKVQMIVAEDGNITEIKALNDPGEGLAAEAERVIKKGPKWIPAKHNGKVVAYRFVQTLTFQLQ